MAAHALSSTVTSSPKPHLRRVELAAPARTIETTVGELIAAVFDSTPNAKAAARLLRSRQLGRKLDREIALIP